MDWLMPALLSFTIGQVVSQVTVFDTTIFLHRAKTHRSIELHRVIDWLCRFVLWLTTGLSWLEWVKIHLKHHAHTDEEGDPHSPFLMGFWSVQLGNVFHYIKQGKDKEGLARYGTDLKEDWWDRTFFKHGLVGLGIGIAILCWLLGVGWGLFAAGIHAVTYVFFLSSSINGLCHWVGDKDFDNTATNVTLLALVAGGEGNHNVHHGYPTSPKFSYDGSVRREFDPAWPIIKFLVAVGLATRQHTIEERLAAR